MRPRGKARRSAANGSYWISYSDMMAGMLFTFALILFMAVFQLVDLQQKKTIELKTKEAQLSTQQSILLDQQSQLQDKEELLAATTLALQEQEEELEKNRTALSSAQQSLSLQQSKIEEQAALLASQQARIDKLVGLRSEIIEALRDELRSAGVDAGVDRNTGAITFSGAVLFDTGKNELKDTGKALLDRFIPIYLRTLMSDEYEEYIRAYPGRGTLKVQISVARGAFPLKNVLVDVSQIYNGVRYSLYNDVTDISGIVDNMVLPARSLESTLNFESSQIPEAEYLVTVFHPDFREMTDCTVVIHDKTETILPVSLVPLTGEREDG